VIVDDQNFENIKTDGNEVPFTEAKNVPFSRSASQGGLIRNEATDQEEINWTGRPMHLNNQDICATEDEPIAQITKKSSNILETLEGEAKSELIEVENEKFLASNEPIAQITKKSSNTLQTTKGEAKSELIDVQNEEILASNEQIAQITKKSSNLLETPEGEAKSELIDIENEELLASNVKIIEHSNKYAMVNDVTVPKEAVEKETNDDTMKKYHEISSEIESNKYEPIKSDIHDVEPIEKNINGEKPIEPNFENTEVSDEPQINYNTAVSSKMVGTEKLANIENSNSKSPQKSS